MAGLRSITWPLLAPSMSTAASLHERGHGAPAAKLEEKPSPSLRGTDSKSTVIKPKREGQHGLFCSSLGESRCGEHSACSTIQPRPPREERKVLGTITIKCCTQEPVAHAPPMCWSQEPALLPRQALASVPFQTHSQPGLGSFHNTQPRTSLAHAVH